MRKQIEEAAQERGLFQSMMLTVLEAIATTVQNDTIDKAEKANTTQNTRKRKSGIFANSHTICKRDLIIVNHSFPVFTDSAGEQGLTSSSVRGK